MQFKLEFSLLLSLFVYSISVFSQRAVTESASTVHFTLPAYNIETANPSQFSYSFAMGRTNFESPEIFESEEICVAAGSKNVLKDAKKIKIFKYRITAETNDAYLVIETPDGEVLHAEEFSNDFARTGTLSNPTTKLIYGDGECYWHPSVLEEAWKGDEAAWKQMHDEKIKARVFENAQRIAQDAFRFGYVNYAVDVYTAKGGKGYDYSELNEAQQQAIAAYGRISNEGAINQQSIDQLMVPVNTWIRYIEQPNLEEKGINTKVLRGLYLNIATAYFQIRNFEKAMEYLELHGKTYANPTFSASDQAVANLSKRIANEQRGIAANPGLSNDFAVLNEKARATPSAYIQVKDLGEGMVSDLGARHHFYAKDAKKEADIAASGGSIYKSNIRQGQYGPTLIMMSMFDGDLNEFPVEATELDVNGLVFTGGYSFKSIPAEIGNMAKLEQINLTASAVTSIPDEIGNLTNLKRLNLSRTQISTLPESIKNLRNLKVLNVKKTKISAAELAKIKSWVPKGCKVIG